MISESVHDLLLPQQFLVSRLPGYGVWLDFPMGAFEDLHNVHTRCQDKSGEEGGYEDKESTKDLLWCRNSMAEFEKKE